MVTIYTVTSLDDSDTLQSNIPDWWCYFTLYHLWLIELIQCHPGWKCFLTKYHPWLMVLILSFSNRIPIRGSSKKGSHVYFLLHVFWVILLFCQIVLLFDINVVLMLSWWTYVTIVQSGVTIVVPWQLSTGSKHDYLFLTDGVAWWSIISDLSVLLDTLPSLSEWCYATEMCTMYLISYQRSFTNLSLIHSMFT